jgi:hypothetical protein
MSFDQNINDNYCMKCTFGHFYGDEVLQIELDGRMVRRTYGQINKWIIDEPTKRCTDRLKVGQIDSTTERQAEG